MDSLTPKGLIVPKPLRSDEIERLVDERPEREMRNARRWGVQGGAAAVAAGVLLMACAGPAASSTPSGTSHATGKIAFVNDKDGNLDNQDDDQTIYVMNPDGTGLHQLTRASTVDAPSWSPDGKKIAFQCVSDLGSQICVMNADGSKMAPVTSSGSNGAPAWSPDGKQIAFMKQEGLPSIYVMNSDGSQPNWLGATHGKTARLAWSPDGKQIAYQDQQDGVARISLIRVNFGGLTSAAAVTSGGDGHPAWSADGKHLAYLKYTTSAQVYVSNSDGKAERAVTNGSGSHGWPTWAPDGSSIAFEGNPSGTLQVYVIGVDGHGQRLLTTLPGASFAPAWTGPVSRA